ncbi:MAG: hypothetical protein NT003_01865 [Candidatus Magasanikbacteria bacterium]|nr:hypothetical protein [Candidatus Magasanikbacteria bacterium]
MAQTINPHTSTRAQVDAIATKILKHMRLPEEHRAVLSGFIVAMSLYELPTRQGMLILHQPDVQTHIIGVKYNNQTRSLDEASMSKIDEATKAGLICRVHDTMKAWSLDEAVFVAARSIGFSLDHQHYTNRPIELPKPVQANDQLRVRTSTSTMVTATA